MSDEQRRPSDLKKQRQRSSLFQRARKSFYRYVIVVFVFELTQMFVPDSNVSRRVEISSVQVKREQRSGCPNTARNTRS